MSSEFERQIQQSSNTESPTEAPIDQAPTAPRQVIIENPQPVPVVNVPSPDSIANYGIQGVIVTLVIALGKPLIDKMYEFFSSSAKNKAELEEEKYRQSVRASNILEESYQEQRKFLQESILSQGATFQKAIDSLTSVKLANQKTTEEMLVLIRENFKEENKSLTLLNQHLESLQATNNNSLKLLMEISRRLKSISLLCTANAPSSEKPKEDS